MTRSVDGVPTSIAQANYELDQHYARLAGKAALHTDHALPAHRAAADSLALKGIPVQCLNAADLAAARDAHRREIHRPD